jgi:hypothetical protein
MAHSHYVMDLYYRESNGSDRYNREVLRIDAADDDAAAAEGQRIDAWRKTGYYTVRAITTSARTNDRVIYTSRVDEETPSAESPPAETVIELARE